MTEWDFRERLDWSQRPSLTKALDLFYRKVFEAKRVLRLEDSIYLPFQKEGIDLFLFGTPEGEISVEEKIRGIFYPDILIETLSSDKTMSPGWAVKPFQADWLLYFRPPDHPNLYDGTAFRRAVQANIGKWEKMYGTRKARNKGYNTINVPVPEKVLLEETGKITGAYVCPFCGTNVSVMELRFSLIKGAYCYHCENVQEKHEK